jgi:uncharacterized protein YcbK (DUF882 family)
MLTALPVVAGEPAVATAPVTHAPAAPVAAAAPSAPNVAAPSVAAPAPAALPIASSIERAAAAAAAAAPLVGPPAPASSARAPAGKPGKRTAKAPRWPTVVLFQVNRRETLRFRLADDQGRPIRGMQKRMNRFLRCHLTNQQHAMHPRLLRLIYETGRHYPGRRIDVVSGYRHPKVAKNPRSPHMKGFACDMHVDGVKNTELRDYFRRTFQHVGVGYYPNSSFVHLDVREGASAFWIDYSGPGQTAIYSDNPDGDLRSGRADSWKPAKINSSWVDEETDGDDASGGLAAGVRTPAPAPTP